MRRWALIAILLLASSACSQVMRYPDGFVARIDDRSLKLQVCAEDAIHVAYAKDPKFFEHQSVVALPNHPHVKWDLASDESSATLTTAKLKARVDLATGTVTFLDSTGRIILAEDPAGRSMTPANVQGENTFHVRQQWQENPDESLYGLGENQLDLTDIKGYDLDLWQHNGTIVIPFLLSSRGWGILWDNTSLTHFGDTRPFEPIPGIDQGSTRPTTRGKVVTWDSQFTPKVSGDYQFQTFSNGGIKVWIDGQLKIDHWRQNWLPWFDQTRVNLSAGQAYPLHIEWTRDQEPGTISLKYKPPPGTSNTSLWSEVGDGIDYYFVYGPQLDKTIAAYRQLTGQAPMPPKWAFGLWQSRQRYETSQQSLDVIDQFRARQIPFDNIVQDWLWWKEAEWGSQKFDPQRFPDPDTWIRTIHEKYHANLMISVWGKFYPGTDNFKAMQSHGYLYDSILNEGLRDWRRHPYTFFDAFNPEADKLFWSQLNKSVFSKGVDAWWMDATEPDLLPDPTLAGTQAHMNPTAMGIGSRVLNAYPLMITRTVYDGQRTAAPNQRVFILTRSAFAGQQRYAAASWSGDTSSTWTALRKQIPAGLSFSISGIPYWTMDIGGFSVPARFSSHNPTPENLDEWRELFTRWFQFGAFCPLLRAHGEFPNREMWEFGNDSSPAYQTQLKFDRLRYRLLPYIYSQAADITQNGGTMMRPLVMDFPADKTAREIVDQYLFGPSLLISPVTTYKARERSVYLPTGSDWYDFWTGDHFAGGQTISSPAPYDVMPIHVRAGSILPFGPDLQYTSEKPPDPITLYVYTGADGTFNLYEDEDTNYNYEHGNFALISIHWNESAKTLSISNRHGSFTGMLTNRTFNIVFVSPDKNIPFSFDPAIDKTVKYNGNAVDIAMQ